MRVCSALNRKIKVKNKINFSIRHWTIILKYAYFNPNNRANYDQVTKIYLPTLITKQVTFSWKCMLSFCFVLHDTTVTRVSDRSQVTSMHEIQLLPLISCFIRVTSLGIFAH